MQATAKKIDTGIFDYQASREGKYLTFSLADMEYGIGFLKVKEIIGPMPVSPVPNMPECVKGVINLRGKEFFAVDLRLKFGLAQSEPNENKFVIMVEIVSDGNKIAMGIIVDSLSGVLNIKDAEIEDASSFNSKLYVLGMAKSGQGVKVLLDIDKVMGKEEIRQLDTGKKWTAPLRLDRLCWSS